MITIATISQESRRSVRAWAVLAPLIPLRALDGKMCNEGTQEGKKAERSHEDEGNQEHNASISGSSHFGVWGGGVGMGSGPAR